MNVINKMHVRLWVIMLLWTATLFGADSAYAQSSDPLAGIDEGITVPTDIRDAVPSDYPNLIYLKSLDN